MLLNSYLPNYFIREVHHFAVKTSPAESYQAICGFDMANIPWIRKLFQLRTFFDQTSDEFLHLTLRDAYKNGAFVLLKEAPDEELVVGAIGKIWRPALQFEQVAPEDFGDFHRKGFGKIAWSMRCEPRIPGGTFVTFELRVGATDSISSAKMRTYYSTIRPFSRAIRASSFRKLTKQLGDAFTDESTRSLPGDGMIEDPAGSFTHAVTIDAPSEAIWPWLVQMGCLRGGWYSYDWLDNAGIPSASRILPDFQNLQQGDILPATPQGEGGFIVLQIDRPQLLLLGGCWDAESGQTLPPDVKPLPLNFFRSTWAFVLEPQTPEATRLVVRARGDFHASNASALQIRAALMRPLHGFMERRQLRNLKQRAEMAQVGAMNR